MLIFIVSVIIVVVGGWNFLYLTRAKAEYPDQADK